MTHSFPTRRSTDLRRHHRNHHNRSQTRSNDHHLASHEFAAVRRATRSVADLARGFVLSSASPARTGFATASKLGCGPEPRSEEHTSELQSLMRNSYAVFCLKKKKKNTNIIC